MVMIGISSWSVFAIQGKNQCEVLWFKVIRWWKKKNNRGKTGRDLSLHFPLVGGCCCNEPNERRRTFEEKRANFAVIVLLKCLLCQLVSALLVQGKQSVAIAFHWPQIKMFTWTIRCFTSATNNVSCLMFRLSFCGNHNHNQLSFIV